MCPPCALLPPLGPLLPPPRLTLGRDRVTDRLDTFNVRRGGWRKAKTVKYRVLIRGLISSNICHTAVEISCFGRVILMAHPGHASTC